MNILVWNVPGLNTKSRRDALHGVVADHNVSIVCVQETKLNVISQRQIYEMLGAEFSSFAYLPASDTRGGILIACRSPHITMVQKQIGEFSVTVEVAIGDTSWHLTSVYGPQADADKIEFLNELRSVRAKSPGALDGGRRLQSNPRCIGQE